MESEADFEKLSQEVMRLITAVVENVGKLKVGEMSEGAVFVFLPEAEDGIVLVRGVKPLPKSAADWEAAMKNDEPDAVLYNFSRRLDETTAVSYFMAAKSTGALMQLVEIDGGRARRARHLSDSEWEKFHSELTVAIYMPLPKDIVPYFKQKEEGQN